MAVAADLAIAAAFEKKDISSKATLRTSRVWSISVFLSNVNVRCIFYFYVLSRSSKDGAR